MFKELPREIANIIYQYCNPFIDAVNAEYKSKIYTVRTCPDGINRGDRRVTVLNPDCLIFIDENHPTLVWAIAQWRCVLANYWFPKIPYMSNIYKFNLRKLNKPEFVCLLPSVLQEKQYDYKNHKNGPHVCGCIECHEHGVCGCTGCVLNKN